jgi:hypothetical protein
MQIVTNPEKEAKIWIISVVDPWKKANQTQEGTGHRRGHDGRPRSVSRMAVWT